MKGTTSLWALVFVALGARLEATDFIRADANSDGAISISDSVFSLHYLFLGRPPPECLGAADANGDGLIDISDAISELNALFLGGPSPPAPFPNPGPDPTPKLDCAAYGNGSPLVDPAAKMEVLSAVAMGGSTRRVVIPIALSSTGPVAAYSGAIRDPSSVLESGVTVQLVDKSGVFQAAFKVAHPLENGGIGFALLLSFIEGTEIPPGQDAVVAELITCVKGGTPAGEYSLTLETGELSASCVFRTQPNGTPIGACPDSGRAIHPALVSGTLTVENDVSPSRACDTSIPPPPLPIHIQFQLENRTGFPGGDVTIPFNIRADRPSQGFSYSIHYDEAIIRATGTDKIFITPSGTPYEFEKFEINNDTGFVVGAAVISLSDTGDVLPPDHDERVLEFDFHIDPLAPIGQTELEFRDGGRGSGGPLRNKLVAGGEEITPDAASSFVFVNGLLNIVPDTVPFVRGDSNGDETVNISDPQFTLGYLFLGGREPRCLDAADANDNGKVDISDAIATLQFLFGGGSLLPQPRTPGLDPTPDDLHCLP